MTLAPRFLVNFWAGLRVARFRRQFGRRALGRANQQAVFSRLMRRAGATTFGRRYGLKDGMTYSEFSELLPLCTYEDFEPFITRMVAGEPDVLVPGKCLFFVESAGTMGLKAKLLPVPEAMLSHFRRGLRDALFHYAHRIGHCGVFLGRNVQIGASTTLIEDQGSYRTSLDGMLSLCLSSWVEANLHSPPVAIAQLPEGSAKNEAAAKAMLGSDVTLLGGTPAGVGEFVDAVNVARGGNPKKPTPLQTHWPNLECCLHHGAPLGIFEKSLRTKLGPTVNFHEIYAAAEGVFAAQDGASPTALHLFTDNGVFYEFLPLNTYKEGQLGKVAWACLPLEKIKAAVDYVLIVTTPAGLTRYVTGDIVRFVTVDPPRLQITGRVGLELNSFGERVTEHDIFETIQAVCYRNDWRAVAFHVAPLEQRIAAGQLIRAHEWWVELGTMTVKTPTGNVLGPALDAELIRRNTHYAGQRDEGVLGPPQIRLVAPGLFNHWAKDQRRVAIASKLPRCRSDRLIADQLAPLTRFHEISKKPFQAL